MITRKKRRMIIIISVILVILIMMVGFALLYLNTDMFKSNQTLFMKYLSKNFENINEMNTALTQKNDYENSLEQNKYTVNTQINVNNTEEIGTTQENTDNVINKLKIISNGQVDKTEQYEYQKMNLYKNENSILGLEYIKNENTYGIRFSDIFQQFLLVDNNNLQELFKKLGYTDEQITNIPNQIDINSTIEKLKINDQEKDQLSKKYLEIIQNGLMAHNFEKEKNKTIKINEKNVQVNEYAVTLTKEQLNNLYLSILEKLKTDEIVLGKLDNLQIIIEQLNQVEKRVSNQENNIKDIFVEKIEQIINKINENNIGKDEIKIIVYENMKNTVRTTIQTPEYEINLDFLSTGSENFIQYNNNNKKKEEVNKITITNRNNETNIINENIIGKEKTTRTLKTTKEVNGNNIIKNTTIKYEDSSNRVELKIGKEIKKVNQFENKVEFGNDNSIKLNDLNKEDLQSIITTAKDGVDNKINQLKSEVDSAEISKVLINAKILPENQTIESIGTTETERVRYNSQFEILKGQNLDNKKVLTAIDAIQDYISNLEVVSNTVLKINLDKNNKNEEVITVLKQFIEDNNKKYNIDVEYDETTGLVNNIVLNIVEK